MTTPDDSVLLHQLAEEYTARVRGGELPDLEEYARRHPPLAERIRALFPTLLFLEGLAGGAPESATVAPGPRLAELTPGQTFNHYRIERELGRGGMGVVYEAVHVPLGKRVALKVLSLGAMPGSAGLERFLREAQTAAGLHHTNIVPVFDIGQAAGLPYYAMQFIEGRGLDQLLQEKTGPTGDEYVRWVAELGVQAAEGLAYAHQRGVIHRDIKPSNLILDSQGVLWITDFGLARRAADPSLTQSGALVGTPRYMSPEQAEAARKPVDHRTDVYSLGATLYELVTRRAPFTGDTPVDILLQIIERDPVPPRRLDPTVPRDLETIIVKAMAKRAEDRYATAAELAEDLRRWLHGEPIQARRIGLAGRAVRWCRRNPVLATVSTAAVVLIMVLTGLFTWRLIVERDEAITAKRVAFQHLCGTLYAQAQTEYASHQPGRRWKILELLRSMEGIRSQLGSELHRSRITLTKEGEANSLMLSGIPTRAECRGLAVQALLLSDLRLQREWPGMLVDPAPHSRVAVLNRPDAKRAADSSVVCLNLVTGEEESLAQLDGNEEWSTMAMSPDGKLFAAQRTLEPGQVRVWELPERKLRVLPPLTGIYPPGSPIPDPRRLIQMAFHPKGNKLAACRSLPNNHIGLVLWDLNTNEPPRDLFDFVPPRFHAYVTEFNPTAVGAFLRLQRALISFEFSPSGRWLTYRSDNGVVLWNVDGAKVDAVLPPPEGFDAVSCAALAFTSSEDLLAIAYVTEVKNTIRFVVDFWNPMTRTRVDKVNVPARGVLRMAFSPDGRYLALHEDVLRILQVPDGREIAVFRIPEGGELAGWHHDGRRFFFASQHGLSLWEPSRESPESAVRHDVLEPRCLALSADGHWLAVKGRLGTSPIRLVHRESGQAREFPDGLPDTRQLRFDPSGRFLGIVRWRSCQVLELETGKVVAEIACTKESHFGNGVFDADGRFLAVQWRDRKRKNGAAVWDVRSKKVLYEFDTGRDDGSLSLDGRYLVSHPDWVNPLLFPMDVGEVDIRDVTTGRQAVSLRDPAPGPLGSSKRNCQPQLSPANRWLMTTTYSVLTRTSARACLWSIADGKRWLDIPGPEEVSSYAFSPDSRLLIVGYDKGTIQVWDIHQREKLFQWQSTMVEVRHLMFTPDGEGIIFNDPQSKEARFLDLKSLKRQLAELGLDWESADASAKHR